MAFTVTGFLDGRAVRVDWDNGRLMGDQDGIIAVLAEAEANDGEPVGPHEGPVTFRDHLTSDLSAMILMAQALAPAVVTGDVPVRPAIPEGAIG